MRSPLACLLLMSPALWTQPATRQLVFETATIKMTDAKGGGGHSHENDAPGMFRGSMTLKSYIMTAYNLKDFQVVGGPNWIDATTYEILGKLERAADVPSENARSMYGVERGTGEQQLHIALQSLLADRFQLKFHHESKEMPAYVLTALKGKFKLPPVPDNGKCGTSSNGDGNGYKLTATCIDMNRFASFLARRLRQPVSNETAVQGLYSFLLRWTNDDLAHAGGGLSQLDPLFSALRDQLGLRLEAKKRLTDIIVVDRAEWPSETNDRESSRRR
jgi:uncharacterized protein (TIGR03435 family)